MESAEILRAAFPGVSFRVRAASYLGVTPQMVSQWNVGRCRLSRQQALRLRERLERRRARLELDAAERLERERAEIDRALALIERLGDRARGPRRVKVKRAGRPRKRRVNRGGAP